MTHFSAGSPGPGNLVPCLAKGWSVRPSKFAFALVSSALIGTAGVVALASSASAAVTVSPLRPLFSSFSAAAGSVLSCPPGRPVSTTTCYLVGAGPGGAPPPGYTSLPGVPNDFAYEVVPVTDGQVGQPLPTGSVDLGQVACPGGPTCVATGVTASGTHVISWLTKGAVAKTEAVPQANYWGDLACTKSFVCAAVGMNYVKQSSGTIDYGVVASVVGGRVSAQVFRSASAFNAASCTAPSSCLVAGATYNASYQDRRGALLSLHNGIPGAMQVVDGTTGLYTLVCGWEQGACLATGTAPGPGGSILPAEVTVAGGKKSLEVLPGSATTAPAVCASAGHCVDYGVVNPNTRGEHGFVAVAVGGKLGAAVSIPSSADVDGLACPVTGSCVGLASYLHGAYGNYSEGIFTFSY